MEVRGDLTLDRIHTCLQVAMGWTDSHLHRFGGQGVKPWQAPWFATAYDEEDEDTGTAESAARIDQVLRTPGDWLTYIYDFCDGWVHRVEIEGVRPATAADAPARCPPEDVGGIPTWNEIAAALRADPDPHGTARLAARGPPRERPTRERRAVVGPPETLAEHRGSGRSRRHTADRGGVDRARLLRAVGPQRDGCASHQRCVCRSRRPRPRPPGDLARLAVTPGGQPRASGSDGVPNEWGPWLTDRIRSEAKSGEIKGRSDPHESMKATSVKPS